MTKLTPDERAELMRLRAHLAKRREHQRAYQQRADVKVKRRAYQRKYEANIRRLVSLAKAAGLDGASPSPDQEIQEIV